MAFIFNANQMTPEEVKRQREIADLLARETASGASNVGQGYARIGQGILSALLRNRADSAERKGIEGVNAKFSATMDPILQRMFEGPKSQPASPGQGAKAMPTSGKAQSVAAKLVKDLGVTPAAAAGIAGNLSHETGNFRNLQEINPVVPGSRGGLGWAQWTGPRRKAYEAWAAQQGLDPMSDDANYGYLKTELTAGPESKVLKSLRGVNDPGQAAQIFSDQFLRPGIPHMDRRIALANAAMPTGGQPDTVQQGGQTVPAPRSPGITIQDNRGPSVAPSQEMPPPVVPQQPDPNNPANQQQMGQVAAQAAGMSQQQIMQGAAQQIDALPMKDIMELYSNPYLNEGQRGLMDMVVKSKLDRGEWRSLGNGYIFNSMTGEAMKVGQPEGPKPTSDMQEYEFAKSQGFKGTFQDYQMGMKKAGATSVNVGGGSDKQVFDEMKARADSARSASTGLRSLGEAEKALPGAITGAAANQRLGLQKVAALFGVGDTASIVDTETFRSAIAPQVAAMLKATVGSTQISNADRDFAEKAAAGAITLDGRSIQRLIDIMQVANTEIVRNFNKDLGTVYPEGQGFDRERALFNVPNVPRLGAPMIYPQPQQSMVPAQQPNANSVAPEGIPQEEWDALTPEEKALWK